MRRSFVSLITVALVMTMATAAFAIQCTSTDRPCAATTSVTLYTGQPVPVCLIGVPVVQIETTAVCLRIQGATSGSSSSGVFIKCGLDDDGYSWSGSGLTHTISLYPGQEWQDVYNGRCKAVLYSN